MFVKTIDDIPAVPVYHFKRRIDKMPTDYIYLPTELNTSNLNERSLWRQLMSFVLSLFMGFLLIPAIILRQWSQVRMYQSDKPSHVYLSLS